MRSNQHLSSEIFPVKSLSSTDRLDMFNLMDLYYANSRKERFELDLNDKNWAVMIRESDSNRLIGFSTQKLFHHNCNNRTSWILFSGDTIIEHTYWGVGGMELILKVGEIMKNAILSKSPDPVYWMLITKGLRTFKFLPLFFEKYYPSVKNSMPNEIRLLMKELGNLKFGEKYDPEKGIIVAQKNDQFLKLQYQPEPSTRKEQDAFFFKKNPGYHKGDELLCLTPLSFENMHPFLRKKIMNSENEAESIHS